LERRFKVHLKDDTELSARLISVSREHDLALLKVDGCKTPSIKSASMGALSQGMKVYAIGSPLGLRDSVTSGVLTRIRDDYLLTDATVLSGSSGGPLVTEVGEVIGINTLKLGKPTSTDGLGAAIPMDTIKAEFGTKIE
jgi:S1-C subfamily serine protease